MKVYSRILALFNKLCTRKKRSHRGSKEKFIYLGESIL